MKLRDSYGIWIFVNLGVVTVLRVNYIVIFYFPRIVEGVKIQYNFRNFAVPHIVVGVNGRYINPNLYGWQICFPPPQAVFVLQLKNETLWLLLLAYYTSFGIIFGHQGLTLLPW